MCLFIHCCYLIDIGSLESKNNWLFHTELRECSDETKADDIASSDTSEDIHENRLNIGVLFHDLQGSVDLSVIGLATNIQEVSGHTVLRLDEIHGCHCQTSTVNHASDVSVESNVV